MIKPGRRLNSPLRPRPSSPKTKPAQKPQTLLEGFCSDSARDERIVFNSKGIMLFVRLDDIEWVEATDHSVQVHIGHASHQLPGPLSAFAGKLPPYRFLQTSTSTLVNLRHIAALRRIAPERYEVRLRNGKCLPLQLAVSQDFAPARLATSASPGPVQN
jgi:DNA-binding LytR/AlgR family response regulator